MRGRSAARGGCLARQVHERGDVLDGAAGRVGHVLSSAWRGIRSHDDVVPDEEPKVGVVDEFRALDVHENRLRLITSGSVTRNCVLDLADLSLESPKSKFSEVAEEGVEERGSGRAKAAERGAEMPAVLLRVLSLERCAAVGQRS